MTPLADLLICLRFFSLLPVPATRREIALGAGGFAAAAAMAPFAGAALAGIPAAVLSLAHAVGLPPAVGAALALTSLVVATGALHEDALADCADGFGGGRTRARKLEIMRDSRIGAFGGVAIALSLYLRAVALGAVLARGLGGGIAAVVVAAALSRTACLAPLVVLPPARAEGVGAASARPSPRSVVGAAAAAIVIAILAAVVALDALRTATAVVVAAAAAMAACAVARWQIGGQTGDVAGATQQMAEAGVLIVFATMP